MARQNKKRTEEERERIAMNLFGEFKQEYPQYFDSSYELPAPKVPTKIQNLDLSKKRMGQVPIDDLQKSVLCGTCIADSSFQIDSGYQNARIQNRHSSRQRAWFFWKWFVCLKEYTSETPFQFQDPDGYQTRTRVDSGEILGKLKITTRIHPHLTDLYSILYRERKRDIRRYWLNHMNDYFLMTIWLDDGSLTNRRQGCICFDSMPEGQQEVFVDYLKAVWQIQAHLRDTGERMKNGPIRYRIHIADQENLLKLLRIIAPIIPVKEMLYKIMFVPKNDAGLLQRWASEVEDLVMPEFRSYIRDEYQKIITNYSKD